MKKTFFWFNLIAISLLFSCKSRVLSPSESDRSMKVLNSNLVNLLTTGSEKTEFKAIAFLLNLAESPLPVHQTKNSVIPDTVGYRFREHSGNYQWDARNKTFLKTSESNFIVLFFPIDRPDTNNVCLRLQQFESQAYSSRPNLPTLILADIQLDNKEIASISHQANITNHLPENINTVIKGSDYELGLKLNRTQINKDGKLKINIYLKTKGFTIIQGNADASIAYSRQGYFFKTIQFDLKLIDHRVVGNIDYGKVNPTAADYIDSFNSNSSIILFEGNDQVGQIVLNRTDQNELLDYFIRFSDGNEVLLSQYIPLLQKVLNLKY